MHRSLFLTALFFFLLSTGCATMFAEKQDTITIKTEPPGAVVYRGTEPLGTTPLSQTFKRSTFEQTVLNIRKEGYKTKELQLMRTIEPVALFNFGFFLTTSGATSWGIDAVTGAMIQYSPNSYIIDMEKESGAPAASETDRRRRMHFVLWNHQALKEDIARGEGEYLSSYYRLINGQESEATFLERAQKSAPDLLNKEDGMDLYEQLEASVHN